MWLKLKKKFFFKTLAKQPRRKAAKGHKLPEPIPIGKEITDTQKKTWILSEVIGSGGFGTVYFGNVSSF